MFCCMRETQFLYCSITSPTVVVCQSRGRHGRTTDGNHTSSSVGFLVLSEIGVFVRILGEPAARRSLATVCNQQPASRCATAGVGSVEPVTSRQVLAKGRQTAVWRARCGCLRIAPATTRR